MPICKNPECGRRFISKEDSPFCERCNEAGRLAEPSDRPKAHLRKRRGVWQMWPVGHHLTRPTTYPLQIKGQIDCVRLAAIWNARNA